jgi:hypothetical protein
MEIPPMTLDRLPRFAILRTAVVGAMALCIATASAADPCPSNVVCLAEAGCASMTNAVGGREANYDGGVSMSASYDWIMRTCVALSQLPFGGTSAGANVEANEDFIVTGIAPGTPLTIHARIRVLANANSPGPSVSASNHASGWLEEAGAGRVETAASSEGPGPPVDIDQVLALDFPNLAGENFRLTMGARSDSREGTSRAGVTLSFVDLPPGAIVQSCHSGAPVPARPVSWGTIKSQYR